MRRETEQLFKATKNLKIGRFDIGGLTMMEIVEMYRNKPYEGMWQMFKIGFLKGQRFEKARKRGARA